MDEKLTEKEIREELKELNEEFEHNIPHYKEFREEISDYWEATLERLSDEDIADIIKESLEKIESWFDFVRTSR